MAERMVSPEFHTAARNRGIDGLRGLSIILVICNHIGIRLPLAQTALAKICPTWLISVLNWRGYEAVFIFFVVSGFLIGQMSLRRWGSLAQIDLHGFYIRRLARIAPLLLALLLALSMMHMMDVPSYVIDKPGQSLAGAISAALGLYLNWYEGYTTWLPGGWDVLWSLSIEEAFYIGFPILALLTRRWWLLLPLLTGLALSLPYSREALAGHEIWQEKAYLPGMAAISTGVIGSLIAERFMTRAMAINQVLIGLGASGLAVVLVFENQLWSFFEQSTLLVLTFSTTGLLLGMSGIHASPRQARSGFVYGLGGLCAMGHHSYEIYLTHMFVVYTSVAIFRSLNIGSQWAFVVYIPAVFICAVLGTAISRYFSTPCDRKLREWLLAKV